MTVDIISWRSTIGCFCTIKALPCRKNKFTLLNFAFQQLLMCALNTTTFFFKKIRNVFYSSIYFACLLIWCSYFCIGVRIFSSISNLMLAHPVVFVFIHHWWIFLLLLRDGDVEPHPGHSRNLLKFMHWNLNSIVAHDGIRVPLIQSYNIIQNKKKIIVSVTYRRHHHDDVNQLNSFINLFQDMCKKITNTKPYLVVHLGYFNAHNTHWCQSDSTDKPGNLLEMVFDNLDLHQLVKEPTHFSGNAATCVDLVVTNQPNIINDCSIEPSLHSTCHHQINHVEVNINNPPLPSYKRKIWHYNRANTNAIKKSMSEFDWKKQLNDISDPNDQVELLSTTLMNIFSNFIPNSDRIVKPTNPPWHSKNITHAYRVYEKACKSHMWKYITLVQLVRWWIKVPQPNNLHIKHRIIVTTNTEEHLHTRPHVIYHPPSHTYIPSEDITKLKINFSIIIRSKTI